MIELAEALGVDDKTVKTVRGDMEIASEIPKLDSEGRQRVHDEADGLTDEDLGPWLQAIEHWEEWRDV